MLDHPRTRSHHARQSRGVRDHAVVMDYRKIPQERVATHGRRGERHEQEPGCDGLVEAARLDCQYSFHEAYSGAGAAENQATCAGLAALRAGIHALRAEAASGDLPRRLVALHSA